MNGPFAIGALGVTLWAACGVLWWFAKSEEIDEALAVIGVDDDEEPVPFDTHVDQAIALTQPCGCGPMCRVHESAYSQWRANLGLPEVWTDETDRELRKLLDGAS